ncbi:MAG: 5'/3'-nucleotidase SurE [Candidatus Puniceispirillaceae bacterium]
MRILISNDDGIDAYGLSLLADLARPYTNDITIIAPMDNRSGAGRSLSLKSDIHLADLGQGRYACSGTPADCVLLGLNVIMKDNPPDLVLSGINHGMNVADDVGYSGTIGAAFEAAIMNIPAIAFSQQNGDGEVDFAPSREAGAKVMHYVMQNLPGKRTVLNVNFPALSAGRVRGIMPTVTDIHKAGDVVYHSEVPNHYRIGPLKMDEDRRAGTDRYALDEGYVSVTPLMMNQSDSEQLSSYSVFDFDAS